MPSNILNKISEKLTGHEDHDQHQQSSNNYQRHQTSRASDDNDFGDYQSGSTSRTRGNKSGSDDLGDHQRGAFADSQGNDKSWDNQNSDMNARGYNSNSQSMRNDQYGDSYQDSVNSSKQQKQSMNSYDDDEYGSSRGQGFSGGRMNDTGKSAANNQYVQQGVDKGKGFINDSISRGY